MQYAVDIGQDDGDGGVQWTELTRFGRRSDAEYYIDKCEHDALRPRCCSFRIREVKR